MNHFAYREVESSTRTSHWQAEMDPPMRADVVGCMCVLQRVGQVQTRREKEREICSMPPLRALPFWGDSRFSADSRRVWPIRAELPSADLANIQALFSVRAFWLAGELIKLDGGGGTCLPAPTWPLPPLLARERGGARVAP